MNYKHVYMLIISRAKFEQKSGLRPKNYGEKYKFLNKYFEFHHILPKSIFPNWAKRESNLVPLTLKEHFFCHQLLIKIYPNSFELKHCLWLMYNTRNGIHKNSKDYEKYKKIMLSRFKDPTYRKLHGEKIKASESRKRYYEKLKKETAIKRALEREKWLAGKEQRKLDGIEKIKKTIANYSAEKRAEINLKISKANRGKPKTEDHKKKDSEAHKGAKNGMFGKSYHDFILKKHGKEKGLEILENRKKLIGDKNRGAKNGMFGKIPNNAIKVIDKTSGKIWISISRFTAETGISIGRLHRHINKGTKIFLNGEEKFFEIKRSS